MIRVLQIGCGAWGKRLLGRLSQLDDVEIVGVVDPLIDGASRLAFTGRTNMALFDDASDALTETKPSHVIVALSNAEARERVLAEIAQHDCVTDVRIEKPVGVIPDDLRDSGKRVSVGLQMNSHELYAIAKSMVQGEVVETVSCIRIGKQRFDDVEAATDFAPHAYGLQYLFQPQSFKVFCKYTPSADIRVTRIYTNTGRSIVVDECSHTIALDGHVVYAVSNHDCLRDCLRLFVDGKPTVPVAEYVKL